ncbi:hypothetical protein [Streptomyces sp. OE57]|uniref:hypothetical protein n=1 Tax=Streptomyces lacaronensis TaxID=3379885 RepID=UPI0039B74FC0
MSTSRRGLAVKSKEKHSERGVRKGATGALIARLDRAERSSEAERLRARTCEPLAIEPGARAGGR